MLQIGLQIDQGVGRRLPVPAGAGQLAYPLGQPALRAPDVAEVGAQRRQVTVQLRRQSHLLEPDHHRVRDPSGSPGLLQVRLRFEPAVAVSVGQP